MTTFTDFVLQTYGKEYFSGRKVFDIGCYNFEKTKKFLDLGAEVYGIDRCIYGATPDGINFVQSDFLNWTPKTKIDILHASNVVQFIETPHVQKKIQELNPNLILIQTMYDYPEPNWPAEKLRPLHFTKDIDWVRYFEPLGYKTIHAKSYEQAQNDLHGVKRTFRYTEYIGEMV